MTTKDISFNTRTDKTISYQYYEDDGTTQRTLTGATVFFTLKENPHDTDADDSEAVLTKTITSHSDAPNGQTLIELTDSDTNIAPKNYFYDVKVKESDGKIYLATKGRCRVSGSPTNRIS